MQKAFIFDMDGVLINSELTWHNQGKGFLQNLYSQDILKKIGSTIGMTLDVEYETARKYGFQMGKREYYRLYDDQAKIIYSQSKITSGLDEFIYFLKKEGFSLGIVSASRQVWIDQVLARIPLRKKFSYVLSMNSCKQLRPKPHPDGYLEAIKVLHAAPETTIILEDSNSGIQAARASGAVTIGFREHLIPDYHQIGAHHYANTLKEVANLVKEVKILLK